MDVEILEHAGFKAVVARSGGIILKDMGDALDLISNVCFGNGCEKLVLYQDNIADDFFELKTRLAGEILQKFTNYNIRVAIIGDFEKYNSKSLNDFIFECNKGKKVLFKSTLEEALEAF